MLSDRELHLSWEVGKPRPPLNRNYVFTGYRVTKNSKVQIGSTPLKKVTMVMLLFTEVQQLTN